MNETIMIITAIGALLALGIVLPIVAIVKTRKIGALERRVAGLEAALLRIMRQVEDRPAVAAPPSTQPAPATQAEQPAEEPAAPVVPPAAALAAPEQRKLEQLIGERWLGWAGVSVLLFGAAFFLKYAFDNRWIGELGRVAIGVLAGIVFLWLGRQRHLAGWRTFSQIFTAGGVTLIYLATYAAYGFYNLIDPTVAFVFLILVVIQAHLLAVFYNAPAIALMGQIGGFLAPILLSTGRDQYVVLFSYIVLLDAGVVLVAFLRRWNWIASLSFAFSHTLFWSWHDDYYHPEKLGAALLFQAAVFVLFVAADLGPIRRGVGIARETWVRLFVNPFVFFATAYTLAEPRYSDWMGAFALLLAALYAGLAKTSLQWSKTDRRPPLIAVAVALLFLTLAIPIQLEANWVTLAWALQGLLLFWLCGRIASPELRYAGLTVFALALGHQLLENTPWDYRAAFTPVLNADFLSGVALSACLVAATIWTWQSSRRMALALGLTAVGLTGLVLTVEVSSYFEVLRRAISVDDYTQQRALRWAGNMSVSLVWAVYACTLVVGGLRRRLAAVRWAGLAWFGITVVKAFFVDIPMLDGVYRIAALLVLGVLLMAAGWGYQKMSRLSLEAPG